MNRYVYQVSFYFTNTHTLCEAILVDAVFLSWIYLAMESTIRILKEFHQTAKLDMYHRLVAVVGFFAVAFALYTLLVIFGELYFLNNLILLVLIVYKLLHLYVEYFIFH